MGCTVKPSTNQASYETLCSSEGKPPGIWVTMTIQSSKFPLAQSHTHTPQPNLPQGWRAPPGCSLSPSPSHNRVSFGFERLASGVLEGTETEPGVVEGEGQGKVWWKS